MFKLFDPNYNPYLLGFGIPVAFELILLAWMYVTRKPRPSVISAVFDPNSLTEPGSRTRTLHNVLSGIILAWAMVALVLGALRQYGMIG